MRLAEFPFISEVKEDYISCRRGQKSRAEAEQTITESYFKELGDADDAPFVWIGLADGQYHLKELTAEVAEKANKALDIVANAAMEVCVGDLNRRRNNYSQAPMPEQTVRKPRPPFCCPWEAGDTFAYPVSDTQIQQHGVPKGYFLFRKVDEIEGVGSVDPVVTMTHWDEETLPVSAEEFMRKPLMKLAKGRLGFPKTTTEYRVELCIKNRKQLESLGLIYLGKFNNIPAPEDEALIKSPGCLLMIMSQRFEEICAIYWKYNLWCSEEQKTD